jgi:hypothetical protein
MKNKTAIDKPLTILLTPNEIRNAIFSGCSSFYCPDPDERRSFGEFDTETLTVENSTNTCQLHFTEYVQENIEDVTQPVSIKNWFYDIVIELKIGAALLTAIYQVTATESDSASNYQKKLAERDFIKAAALIGCKVESKLVSVKC